MRTEQARGIQVDAPLIITPRLMVGVMIRGAFLSLGCTGRNVQGRTEYECYLDLPDGSEHEITDLRSGCQAGDEREGVASLLSFLGAAAERYHYHCRYPERDDGDSDMFPPAVTQWASENADEISMLAYEIEYPTLEEVTD